MVRRIEDMSDAEFLRFIIRSGVLNLNRVERMKKILDRLEKKPKVSIATKSDAELMGFLLRCAQELYSLAPDDVRQIDALARQIDGIKVSSAQESTEEFVDVRGTKPKPPLGKIRESAYGLPDVEAEEIGYRAAITRIPQEAEGAALRPFFIKIGRRAFADSLCRAYQPPTPDELKGMVSTYMNAFCLGTRGKTHEQAMAEVAGWLFEHRRLRFMKAQDSAVDEVVGIIISECIGKTDYSGPAARPIAEKIVQRIDEIRGRKTSEKMADQND